MEILGEGDDFDITEIGDGNLNFVYRVACSGHPERSVILKQAVPFLRVAGESWPLSRDRMIFEIRAARVYHDLVPEFVPEVYHADEEMSVLVMEDLRDLQVLRYPMIEGTVFPDLGKDIGKFLAISLFRTSYLGMDSIERRQLMQQFNLNDELCKLTEEFIFTFPFIEHDSNYVNPETNAYALEIFRGDSEYRQRILRFKELFLSKTDALCHGDLHTGSLMVGQNSTYVIDGEFAFFGPFGFDIGKIIANFLLCYTSHFHHSQDSTYQNWLLQECAAIWQAFKHEFERLWSETSNSALLYDGFLTPDEMKLYKQNFMDRIFQDAVGFCACSIARRTVGIAGVADIRGIEDLVIRTRLEKTNIDLSHRLLMKYDEIQNMEQFVDTVEDFYSQRNTRTSGGANERSNAGDHSSRR